MAALPCLCISVYELLNETQCKITLRTKLGKKAFSIYMRAEWGKDKAEHLK